MKIKKFLAILATALACSTSQATLVTINFDNLAAGTIVTNQYSGVTFANAVTLGLEAPFNMVIVDSASGNAQPQPSTPITAVFDSAVSFVSLLGVDIGQNSFLLRAFDAADAEIGNVFYTGTGTGSDPRVTQTLSLSVAGIKSVRFSQVTDVNNNSIDDGIAFDNFVFEDGRTVPEPTSLALMGLALAGLAAAKRRKV